MKIKLLFPFFLFPALIIAQGTWTQKANFGGLSRYNPVAFCIGTKAYVGTGAAWATGPCYDDFWEWDQATNVWTQKANYGGGVMGGAVGFAIESYGYVGTGSPNNLHPSGTCSNTFWQYNPSTNTWMQKANFGGTARVFAVGFSIGRYGYIGTGYDGQTSNGGTTDFWEYDSQSDIWTKKSDFGGSARFLAAGFSIGDKGYIGTGCGYSTGYVNGFWEWDRQTDTWQQKANLPLTVLGEGVAFAIGDYGYLGTGTTQTGYGSFSTFWKYVPQNNLWTQVANFGGGLREQAVGFAIGCKGYVGLGWVNDSPSSLKKDFWEYTPDTCAGLGVQENDISAIVVISPNPSSGKFILRSGVSKGEVSIYTASGTRVYSAKINSEKTAFDLRDQSSGIYFLQLTSEKGIARKKIVISK